MKQSYLKYIETTEMIDEGPTAGLTRLQHVGVVTVLDENGNEWFPDQSVPIEVATKSFYDPSNVYKWGETVTATTATFTGDDDDNPLEIWARWQYRLNDESNFIDDERHSGLPNSPTKVEFLIPENTAEVKFFTSAKEKGDIPEEQEFASSVTRIVDVIQPSVTVENMTGSPVTSRTGERAKLEVRTSTNYEPEYFWQFEDPNGSYRNASEANLEKYYPDSFFTLFNGFQTFSFSFVWVAGAPAPTTFRCRVRDVYGEDKYVQDFTSLINVIYEDSLPFEEQTFGVVEEASFILEGEYEEGSSFTVDDFGINTHPSHIKAYYWFSCDSTSDVNNLNNYKQRGRNEDYQLGEYDFLTDQTWRVLFFYETDESSADGEYKELSYWTNPQSFE